MGGAAAAVFRPGRAVPGAPQDRRREDTRRGGGKPAGSDRSVLESTVPTLLAPTDTAHVTSTAREGLRGGARGTDYETVSELVAAVFL